MSQVVSEPVLDQAPPGLDQFWFDQYSIDDMHKVRSSIFMFVDLFGLARFEMKSLARFCLTVRKNYRRVPYHVLHRPFFSFDNKKTINDYN